MKTKNVCDKCENRLTEEELESEQDLCDDCHLKKEIHLHNQRAALQ